MENLKQEDLVFRSPYTSYASLTPFALLLVSARHISVRDHLSYYDAAHVSVSVSLLLSSRNMVLHCHTRDGQNDD